MSRKIVACDTFVMMIVGGTNQFLYLCTVIKDVFPFDD
jgi:hypothetical protein